jgi:rhomboid protease GluP
MDGQIDFTQFEESELVEMFSRIDPRFAPINAERLKTLLIQKGYVIYDDDWGPGTAVPSPAKLQSLIGSPQPVQFEVKFSENTGLFRGLEPAHNDFGFIGSGSVKADAAILSISGRRLGIAFGFIGSFVPQRTDLNRKCITDVESDSNAVHIVYRPQGENSKAITLYLPDPPAAQRLSATLPQARSSDFKPQLKEQLEFERRLIAQSPRTPVTVGLVAVNVLLYLVTLIVGAASGTANGATQILLGANFGPYTTDGEWWRLFSCMFIHFGFLHVAFNMWALASFGPLVERLYGSLTYALIYLIAGIAASLASVSWHPDVNSAGASGAIFGVLGALLAAQLRSGPSFPANIVRPLRNLTLAYTGYSLLTGLTNAGVDNAAHFGGVASGFLMGGIMVRPVAGTRALDNTRRFAWMLSVAAVVLAVGFWCAIWRSQSLQGEALYGRTLRWYQAGEDAANREFASAEAASKAGRERQVGFAKRLEHHVIPFWREANARTRAVELDPSSRSLPALQFLRSLSASRLTAFQDYDAGLRAGDAAEITKAKMELATGNHNIDEWRTQHGSSR